MEDTGHSKGLHKHALSGHFSRPVLQYYSATHTFFFSHACRSLQTSYKSMIWERERTLTGIH